MNAPINILFLCTGNSARSILAECLANHLGRGRIRAYSAGSHPAGRVHPFALEVLQSAGISTDGVRSKNWEEFSAADAPEMDLIITVCDNAAGEACPFWPGNPATAHWGYPDPAAVQGPDDVKRKAFQHTMDALRSRIQLLLDMPIDRLNQASLQKQARSLCAS
jgi:arsenate reductase (thioredoxin)